MVIINEPDNLFSGNTKISSCLAFAQSYREQVCQRVSIILIEKAAIESVIHQYGIKFVHQDTSQEWLLYINLDKIKICSYLVESINFTNNLDRVYIIMFFV